MKSNLLKIGSLLVLANLGATAGASTGLSFLGTLTERNQSTILPVKKIVAEPQAALPNIVAAQKIDASKTETVIQVTPPAKAVGQNIAAATNPIAPTKATTSLPSKPTTPIITAKAAPQVGWYECAIGSWNKLKELAGQYMPSQKALMTGALTVIAASNTWQRYCQAKTAYNNNNIKKCLTSSVLTALSAAGTVMASNIYHQKNGSLLSTLLIGATALDIFYQKICSSEISQIKQESIIEQKESMQNIKCAGCSQSIFNAANVNFNNCNNKSLASENKQISFLDGDSVFSSKSNSCTVIYCKSCAER